MTLNQPVVSYYESIKKTRVLKTITLKDWITSIRDSEHSPAIEHIRTLSLTKEELREYKLQFPVITANFLYNYTKNDTNIINSTGLLYIDIDVPNFDINSISNKVIAYNKSFRGKGYSVYVRVDGITKANFKTNYEYICKDLGVEFTKDKNAVKASQYTLLSYDKDAYYNDEPFVYIAINDSKSGNPTLNSDSTTKSGNPKLNSATTSFTTIDSKSTVDYDDNIKSGNPKLNTSTNTYNVGLPLFENSNDDRKLRFDNLDEFAIDEDIPYITNWVDGFKVVKAFIPPTKISDNRYNTLLAYANNLLWLNQSILTNEWLTNILKGQSRRCFDIPVQDYRIKSIVDSLFKYLEEGSLKPRYTIRHVIINKNVSTRQEKRTMVNDAIADKYKSKATTTIKEIIDSWNDDNGKITAKKIAELSTISYKTIRKYIDVFATEIAKKNKERKQQVDKPTPTVLDVSKIQNLTPIMIKACYPLISDFGAEMIFKTLSDDGQTLTIALDDERILNHVKLLTTKKENQ